MEDLAVGLRLPVPPFPFFFPCFPNLIFFFLRPLILAHPKLPKDIH